MSKGLDGHSMPMFDAMLCRCHPRASGRGGSRDFFFRYRPALEGGGEQGVFVQEAARQAEFREPGFINVDATIISATNASVYPHIR